MHVKLRHLGISLSALLVLGTVSSAAVAQGTFGVGAGILVLPRTCGLGGRQLGFGVKLIGDHRRRLDFTLDYFTSQQSDSMFGCGPPPCSPVWSVESWRMQSIGGGPKFAARIGDIASRLSWEPRLFTSEASR